MAAASSSATTVWDGGLAKGSGVTTPDSGAFPETDVSWASRTARAAGKTSPEELLAAAHSACYCMGLSHELGEAGTPPGHLECTATVDFVPGEGVKSSHLVVTGQVEGIDQDDVRRRRRGGRRGLPDLRRAEGQRRDHGGRDAWRASAAARSRWRRTSCVTSSGRSSASRCPAFVISCSVASGSSACRRRAICGKSSTSRSP